MCSTNNQTSNNAKDALLTNELSKVIPNAAVFVKTKKGLYSTNGCVTIFPDKYDSNFKEEGIYADLQIKKELESYLFVSGYEIFTEELTETDARFYANHRNSSVVSMQNIKIGRASSYTKLVLFNGETHYVALYDDEIICMSRIPAPAHMESIGLEGAASKWFSENIANVYDKYVISSLSITNDKSDEEKIFSKIDILQIISKTPKEINKVNVKLATIIAELMVFDTKECFLLGSNVSLNMVFQNLVRVQNAQYTRYFSITEISTFEITAEHVVNVLAQLDYDIDITKCIYGIATKYRIIGNINPYENIEFSDNENVDYSMQEYICYALKVNPLVVTTMVPASFIRRYRKDNDKVEAAINTAIEEEITLHKKIESAVKNLSIDEAHKYNYKALKNNN